MRSILLAAGLAQLAQQNQVLSNLIQISGFKLGLQPATQAQMELWDEAEPALSSMTGTVVLSSDDSYISYTPSFHNTVKLTCFVPDFQPQIAIANVVLFSRYNGIEVPFSFNASDAPGGFIKLMSDGESPGFGYWFDLVLTLPNLANRFDFSNLSLRTPTFADIDNEQVLPRAVLEGPDDLLLETHTQDPRPATVFNSREVHWGFCPGLLPLVADDSLVLSGGSSGDGYAIATLTALQENFPVARASGLAFKLDGTVYSQDFTTDTFVLTVSDPLTGSVVYTTRSPSTVLYNSSTALICSVPPSVFALTRDSYRYSLSRVHSGVATTILLGSFVVS